MDKYKWIIRDLNNGKIIYICPNCYAIADIRIKDTDNEPFNFCPYCGADMRGENK